MKTTTIIAAFAALASQVVQAQTVKVTNFLGMRTIEVPGYKITYLDIGSKAEPTVTDTSGKTTYYPANKAAKTKRDDALESYLSRRGLTIDDLEGLFAREAEPEFDDEDLYSYDY